jgi:hypothetical protein
VNTDVHGFGLILSPARLPVSPLRRSEGVSIVSTTYAVCLVDACAALSSRRDFSDRIYSGAERAEAHAEVHAGDAACRAGVAGRTSGRLRRSDRNVGGHRQVASPGDSDAPRVTGPTTTLEPKRCKRCAQYHSSLSAVDALWWQRNIFARRPLMRRRPSSYCCVNIGTCPTRSYTPSAADGHSSGDVPH